MSGHGDNPGGHFDPGHTPEEVKARTGDKHEKHDVRSRPLIAFMIVVLVALGVINVAIGGYGWLLKVYRQRTTAPRSELTRLEVIPPEPRLQSSPKADMDEMLKSEATLMNHYDVADAKAGLYRIPVERAMELVAQRGLPPRRHDIPTTAGAYMTLMATSATAAMKTQVNITSAPMMHPGSAVTSGTARRSGTPR